MERITHSHFHFVLGTMLDFWHTHEHDCSGNRNFNSLHHHAPLEHDDFPPGVLEKTDNYTTHPFPGEVMEQLFIGDIVHGHLNGYFGRDHYECARVEAFGHDWAVIRHLENGIACTGSGPGIVQELKLGRSFQVGYEHSSGCPEE